MEGTLSMTTIEEEQDNLSVALSLRNLSQIDEKTSITSFNECSDWIRLRYLKSWQNGMIMKNTLSVSYPIQDT